MLFSGAEGLESSDGKVLAKRLPETAGQDNSKLSRGQVMRQIPCGTPMKLPPGKQLSMISSSNPYCKESFCLSLSLSLSVSLSLY